MYTPAEIRVAYGINNLALDGTGQTIAIVDDDPNIFQALDAFDTQFGPTDSGPSLYQLYGPAATFLTVLNQRGDATALPATDPIGAGTSNWEMEEALDIEWAHAIAPGAHIILVESDSQSLADLMAGVATAASQPSVSVVSMSWGLAEGQVVSAADEALYDSYLTTPAGHQGVTFVASTGDYGTLDPEYPAFSPNVVAVGGTSLFLNADNSYQMETGWGYNSAAQGTFIGSGRGLSLYEAEPAWQLAVQNTGYRSTPDVSLVADPATGAWIADPYNLPADNPWAIVGGTSLSAPRWAGLFLLANQGRVAAGAATFNSTNPQEAQQALYSLPIGDFNQILSGTNGGYNVGAGYNLVTGLGSPIAGLLVPDLIAYTYSTTVNTQRTVTVTGSGGGSGTGGNLPANVVIQVFAVFDAEFVAFPGLAANRGQSVKRPSEAATSPPSLSTHVALAPARSSGSLVVAAPTEPGTLPAITQPADRPATSAAALPHSEAAPVLEGAGMPTGHGSGGAVVTAGGLQAPPPATLDAASAALGRHLSLAPVMVAPVSAGPAEAVPLRQAGAGNTLRTALVSAATPSGSELYLQGGSGGMVLIGGEGDEVVIGDSGRDFLLGGFGGEATSTADAGVTAEPDTLSPGEAAIDAVFLQWEA